MSALIGSPRQFDPATDDFESWIKLFERFLIANKMDKSKDDSKDRCLAILHSCLGLPTFSLLENLLSPAEPATSTYDTCVAVLTKHYKPPPKAMSERFKFSCRKQRPGETVAVFLADLRKLAVTCKFQANLENHLRDQFAFGLSTESTQRKIFAEEDNVTLERVVQIATAAEAAHASTTIVREGQSSSEQVLASKFKKFGKPNHSRPPADSGKKPGQQHQQYKKSCPNCGSQQHSAAKDCPHKDVKCFKCGKPGHFAKFCKSSHKNTKQSQCKNVNDDSLVNQVKQCRGIITVDVKINGIIHNMEFDTGSGRSFISEKFWRELGCPALQPSNFEFVPYSNHTFSPQGEFSAWFEYKGQKVQHIFFVAGGGSLLGRDLMRAIKFDWNDIKEQCNIVTPSAKLTLDSVLREYEDVFGPTNVKTKNFKAKIVLKDDAIPKFLKARPIPFALRGKVDNELDLLEKDGKIERVEHSEWASPLVVVPKPNGRVRITGDFKHTINSQLHITQYPLARVDELMSTISGGEKFSKMDGADGFYQIEVEDTCKKFLVINTHRGLYRYNVLPQGIASSPAIFQEFMDRLLQGIPMSGSFMDDSICTGKDDQEHLRHLKAVLQRMRESNYRLSKSKCVFLKPSVEYLGYVITKNGILTSPRKVEAIKSMKRPRDQTEVKSFLGLVNFYGKFVPFISDKCEPLYRLTKKDVKFKWTAECESAFREVKNVLSSDPVLVHHDQSLPIGVSCDASSIGLGVVLFHRFPDGSERPIAYASKILTPTEKRYGQIEREALAIVYGIKKFHQFLCGRRFKLVTDHEPLLSIFGSKKQVPSYTANRLHRWALYLSEFQFDIEYRNTLQHGNADALSRLPNSDATEDVNFVRQEELEVNAIASEFLDVLPITSKQIRVQTSRDKLLSQVFRFVSDQWPAKVDKTSELHPYFVHRDELTIVHGVIMWGIRVVVPTSLRKKLLDNLHEAHSGIVRMKTLAREFIWWPHIDRDIEILGKSCLQCAADRPNPASAPLHPWKFPERPWQRLHVDLAGPFMNSMWLIVVDAYSKWPEVFKLHSNSTSASCITRIRECFARFGLPDQIVSDNGPQFISEEFQTFCKSNGVRHSTSSAYHPRSNGQAERFIGSFKSAMKSAKGGGDMDLKLQRFLLQYRITAHVTTGSSPAELLQFRKLKSLLDLVRPDVNTKVAESQQQQVENYDKSVKYRQFQIGQTVWVQTFWKSEQKWSRGVIVKAVGPVSYDVKVGDRVIKRHVDNILNAEIKLPKQRPADQPTETIQLEPDVPPQPRTPSRVPVPSPVRVPVTPAAQTPPPTVRSPIWLTPPSGSPTSSSSPPSPPDDLRGDPDWDPGRQIKKG